MRSLLNWKRKIDYWLGDRWSSLNHLEQVIVLLGVGVAIGVTIVTIGMQVVDTITNRYDN